MKQFFGDNLLLNSEAAKIIYRKIKELPIIDYHCHLNEREIAEDKVFSDIGELWLSCDHYKWRAMRLCGVDEKYITGEAPFREKFFKYAEIMPKLIGNPLYYWTHMELKAVFGINVPLDSRSVQTIYNEANAKLKELSVRKILEKFNVEYIATTDDPVSDLKHHGKFGQTKVAPTFRPDRIFKYEKEYIEKLGAAGDIRIISLNDLKKAYESRLGYFISNGCKISDHGMGSLPSGDISENEAGILFSKRETLNPIEKEKLFSHLMYFFGRLYKKNGITMQLHFAAFRNINSKMYSRLGIDSGFDVMRGNVDTDSLAIFLNNLNNDGCLPKTVLYSLNPGAIPSAATVSGAFRDVLVGPAWWFNDTVEGIKKQLSVISEYAALGTNLGMLTDSRSFTSYMRFDFFRRILADFVGSLADKGETDMDTAINIAKNISYYNTKTFLGI